MTSFDIHLDMLSNIVTLLYENNMVENSLPSAYPS
jgi:hypothetical protein